LLWFNNGYHAEHHFRPKVHWTRMKQLHNEIAEAQSREGVRVIRPPHAFGFLDPNLPPLRPLMPRDLSQEPRGIRATLPVAAKTRLVGSSDRSSPQNAPVS
jgi:hypothetical protein